MMISAAAGLALFIYWAITRKLGRGELDKAIFRSNSMPYYLPASVVIGWLALYMVASGLAEGLTGEMPDWQQKLVTYSIFALVEIVIIVFVLAAAEKYFAAGLSGFGLRANGILKDMAAGATMFVAAWPLVMGALYLVVRIGTIIEGPDFQMQQNEGLAVILENNQWGLRIFVIFFAAVITPIFEELLFRGLVQSYFRNIGYGPWRTIIVASIIFSALHPWMHLPALMILSVFMGYAYEKSGSLLQSIFIHCFFNSASIAIALLK
jgi:membrane protease YdiL (CAAX protease family)